MGKRERERKGRRNMGEVLRAELVKGERIRVEEKGAFSQGQQRGGPVQFDLTIFNGDGMGRGSAWRAWPGLLASILLIFGRPIFRFGSFRAAHWIRWYAAARPRCHRRGRAWGPCHAHVIQGSLSPSDALLQTLFWGRRQALR